jgi:hypothetical protein
MIVEAYITADELVVYCRLPDDTSHELLSREIHQISLTHKAYVTYTIRYNL